MLSTSTQRLSQTVAIASLEKKKQEERGEHLMRVSLSLSSKGRNSETLWECTKCF